MFNCDAPARSVQNREAGEEERTSVGALQHNKKQQSMKIKVDEWWNVVGLLTYFLRWTFLFLIYATAAAVT